jgi:hypothetical protein
MNFKGPSASTARSSSETREFNWCLTPVPLERVSLTHLNYAFVYPGRQNYAGLLTENDVTEQVAAISCYTADF